jgi:hypothetical protein
LKKSITVKHLEGEEFNPSTGTMEQTFSEHNVKALVQYYSNAELKSTVISPSDRKVSFLCADIDFVPVIDDDKLIIDGSTLPIKDVKQDASESIYQIRV